MRKLLNPENQNIVQKAGLFVVILLSLIAIFLHYPFEGYVTEEYVVVKFGSSVCPDEQSHGREWLKSATLEEINRYGDQLQRCNDKKEFVPLSPLEWESEKPLIEWLAPVSHLLAVIALLVTVGLVWVAVFKSKQGGDS